MESIAVLVALHTAHGAITAYGGDYVDRELFCSTASNPLYYNDFTPPWVALPAREHGITWQCGDLIYIPGHGMFRALDAGPFGAHCVVTGDQCPSIVADLPSFEATVRSFEGQVINLSAVARACRARGWCDG